MTNDSYSAGLISQSFWFIEFKKIVRLLSEGKSDEEIKDLCLNENIFGAAKEYRAKRMYGYIIKRAGTLDKELINLFVSSNLATQKLINLISIMSLDRLFFECVLEVYREKVILGVPTIEDSDVNIFFNNKTVQCEDIGSWKTSTLNHLRTNYINYLTDANLITVIDKKKTITPPILDVALERYLVATNRKAVVKAITGVN